MPTRPRAYARSTRCRETHKVCKSKPSCVTLAHVSSNCPDDLTGHVWGTRPELDSALRNCHSRWLIPCSCQKAGGVSLNLSRRLEAVWV